MRLASTHPADRPDVALLGEEVVAGKERLIDRRDFELEVVEVLGKWQRVRADWKCTAAVLSNQRAAEVACLATVLKGANPQSLDLPPWRLTAFRRLIGDAGPSRQIGSILGVIVKFL